MEFRTLEASEIELRVGATTAKGFSLLLYKDSRCDMALLDETVGSMNWKREHSRDNANCIVSIWDAEKNQWISKEDTGTESQTEREKGLASDSFKRACVNWGIGRELYTAPFIWISGHVSQDSKARSGYRADQKFVSGLKVSVIEYSDKRTITKLSIEDADGDIVYTHGMKRPAKKKQKVEQKADDNPVISTDHAKIIKEGLEATNSDVEKFLSLFDAKSVDEMLEQHYEKAIELLDKKRKKLQKGA